MRARMRSLLALAVLSVAPAHLAATPAYAGEWLAGDLHAHTTYSHDSFGGPDDDNTELAEAHTLGHTVSSQFAVAATRDLDYLAITDHNDVRSQSDEGFGTGGVIGVPGYENSLDGHAQMLGATEILDNGDQSAAAVGALAQSLRDDYGGVFQVNHPAEGSTDFPHDTDWGYGYELVPDTVEVWNISRLYQPPLPSASSNDDAVRYWEGWLDRGARVAATGGSDNHYLATTAVQGVGQPTTWVYASDRSAAGVLEGLRAGHTFISHQPPALGGPRLFLEADGDGDGNFESIAGDAVRDPDELRVRVEGAPGSMLRIVGTGGRELADPVPVTGAEFEHRFDVASGTTWVRAEIFEPDGAEERQAVCDDAIGDETTYCRNALAVLAMTSAIHLLPADPAPPGDETGGASPPDDVQADGPGPSSDPPVGGEAENPNRAPACRRATRGDDRVRGTAADDCLKGRRGDDRLRGGRGDDRLAGGAGDDRISAGPGVDAVICGGGRDRAHVDRRDSLRGCEIVR